LLYFFRENVLDAAELISGPNSKSTKLSDNNVCLRRLHLNMECSGNRRNNEEDIGSFLSSNDKHCQKSKLLTSEN